MELGVRVAVVPTLGEAEVIVGLLETEGIQAMQRASQRRRVLVTADRLIEVSSQRPTRTEPASWSSRTPKSRPVRRRQTI